METAHMERLASLEVKVDEAEKRASDHESRIRYLEKAIVAIAVFLGGLEGFVNVFKVVMGR